jgi:hypothetical protein
MKQPFPPFIRIFWKYEDLDISSMACEVIADFTRASISSQAKPTGGRRLAEHDSKDRSPSSLT